MKYPLITLSIALVGSAMSPLYVSAQEKTAPSAWQAFSNLPEEKRAEFATSLAKAKNLYKQKRIFDSLEKTFDLDEIFPNHPSSLSLRAACYVELRYFSKAKAIFKKSLKENPNNTSIAFNLAEIEFVSNNWKAAEKGFSEILKSLPESNKDLYRLCEFKILLSKIKQGQIKEATAMKDKYDKWDDSPFFYYSRWALLNHQNKTKEATKMLKNCATIWADPEGLAAWNDTVKEFGNTEPDLFSNSQPTP